MQKKYIWLVAVVVTVLVIDQWTKFAILESLTTALDGVPSRFSAFISSAPELGNDGYHFRTKDQMVLSPDFFRLRYAENPGAAFGLFRSLPEGARAPLFHVVSIGAVILISFYFSKLTGDPKEKWAKVGLPLVLGGAIGNYLDRLARGFVIDFLEAHWFEKAYWPAFNVADICICVGVGCLLVDSFVRKEKPTAATA